MNTSSANISGTTLAPTVSWLFLVLVGFLTISELMAQNPTNKRSSMEKQTTQEATVAATPKAILVATPTPSPVPYCIWPPKDEEDKCRVLKAFVKALEQSTHTTTQEEKDFRASLLKCDTTNCTAPREAVQKILDADNPNKVKIPAVMFYFDPNVPSGSTECSKLRSFCGVVPLNGCFTVLSLPSDTNPPGPNHWNDPIAVFEGHLRCCYEPWAPQVLCR